MQGKQLRKLETELWRAADQLRANSKLTASEYSMPVLGLIFLRHAQNRFDKVRIEVEKNLPMHPQRGMRPITKNDFLEKNALFLPEQSRFDYLVSLPESADVGEAIDEAMKQIEAEYETLQGVLPKNFSIFSKDLLRELLRIFNKEVLQKAEGDLFGKIYEYFLGKFAMTGAQEGGEFFTPMSLVQTIVNVIEPDHGIVFDPACGSAGMFVQTGYFIETEGLNPAEKVTFKGQEKAELNTKLAKMNLAVHGLEGNILEGNTFYEDKHNLVGGADYVMANPPFNVDGVDKAKDAVKKDPRLVLDGKVNLPKNDNANYLWIQYFYNYLTPTGRAGFVMASSASDAGHSEKDIREKLVRTGAVDVMMAIGNNFFYTRSLPCTLWFFDRGKESSSPQPSPRGEGGRTSPQSSQGGERTSPQPSPRGEGGRTSTTATLQMERGARDLTQIIRTVETEIPKQLLINARALRQDATEPEELLWQLLRNRQLNNLKFRRQHPLKAGFILDFFCAEAKLGIEVDGGYHSKQEQQEADRLRTERIKEYGINIVRFSNEEVLNDTERVLREIVMRSSPLTSEEGEKSSPRPSPDGEGVRTSPQAPLQVERRERYSAQQSSNEKISLQIGTLPSPNGEGSGVRRKDTILMLDARKIYRKVTSKVNDFSPEQLQNLICIVNLYRGNGLKMQSTVQGYLETAANLAVETADATSQLQTQIKSLTQTLSKREGLKICETLANRVLELEEDCNEIFQKQDELIAAAKRVKADVVALEGVAHLCKALRKPQDKLIKQLLDAIATATKEHQLTKNKDWKELDVRAKYLLPLTSLQLTLSGNPDEEEPGLLHETEYFWRQAHWLTSRFPDGVYADVEGLCKVVTTDEVAAKDWSLSPGRYVGVDPATDDDFDYEQRLAEIHIELEGLNEEAIALANTIADNYKGLVL